MKKMQVSVGDEPDGLEHAVEHQGCDGKQIRAEREKCAVSAEIRAVATAKKSDR